jgi:hypothetical protein
LLLFTPQRNMQARGEPRLALEWLRLWGQGLEFDDGEGRGSGGAVGSVRKEKTMIEEGGVGG